MKMTSLQPYKRSLRRRSHYSLNPNTRTSCSPTTEEEKRVRSPDIFRKSFKAIVNAKGP